MLERMADTMTRRRTLRRGAALLTGLVRCGVCGHSMHVHYKEPTFPVCVCQKLDALCRKPTCQHLGGQPIDAAVVEEFFRVLQPAQIDALEQVNAKQAEQSATFIHHLQQDVRGCNLPPPVPNGSITTSNPENRLIAATLENAWEEVLQELTRTRDASLRRRHSRRRTPSSRRNCARPSRMSAGGCRTSGPS